MEAVKRKNQMREINDIKNFLNFLKYDLRRILLVIFLSILFAVFEGVGMGAIVPVLQLIENKGSPGGQLWNYLESFFRLINLPLNFSILLFVLFIIFGIKQIIGHYRKYYQYKIAFDFILKLRHDLFEKVITSDIGYFNKNRIGSLVNSMIMEASIAGSGFIIMVELLNTLLIVLIFGLLLLFLSWKMTLVAFFMTLLISLLLNRKVITSRNVKTRIVELNNMLNSKVVEAFSAVRLIKSSVTEKEEISKLHNIAGENSNQQLKFDMNGVDIALIFEFIIFSTILIILYFSVEILKMPFSFLAVFMLIIVRMQPYMQSINTHRHLIAGYSASLSNILKIMDDARTSSSIRNGSIPFETLHQSIELKDVDFSYDQQDKVLNKINLTIKKGELTAIVGSSGSGKSTLIDLILRFYDLSSGKILIDGVDLKELDLSSFRKTIGFVSQDTFLFNDTVAANIGYGCAVSNDELIEASKVAHAHEFIVQLPDKYNTFVGDRGVKLSGGQRQRLALARAIVRQPQIMILDEATSALDTESERMIQDSLKKLGRKYTIIAIAHRISTIENADKIAVLEGGKLVEEGTHDSLLKSGGHYSKYYKLQFNDRID